MAKADRTTPAVPPTIREVLDGELKDARADGQKKGVPPFYGTPLASAWSTALTRALSAAVGRRLPESGG